MDPDADLVIVSMHERGFPQADLYLGMAKYSATEFLAISPSADSFFTMKTGDTLEMAIEKARKAAGQ